MANYFTFGVPSNYIANLERSFIAFYFLISEMLLTAYYVKTSSYCAYAIYVELFLLLPLPPN